MIGSLALFGKSVFTEWEFCAVILAAMLTAPHLKIQDLDLTLIIAALTLTRFTSNASPVWRWLLLLLMLTPAIFVASTPRNAQTYPFIPIVIVVLFVVFLWLGCRGIIEPKRAA
jgi:hypothetical protein